jgi:hypothetical protein
MWKSDGFEMDAGYKWIDSALQSGGALSRTVREYASLPAGRLLCTLPQSVPFVHDFDDAWELEPEGWTEDFVSYVQSLRGRGCLLLDGDSIDRVLIGRNYNRQNPYLNRAYLGDESSLGLTSPACLRMTLRRRSGCLCTSIHLRRSSSMGIRLSLV